MSREHLIPSAELHTLRDLELVTRRTAEGLRQGLHRSPFHGYSAEFSQYRHYRPGDDLKYVDWKAFARTDRIYTRQFRETTNLSALLVLDASRSMDYPAGDPRSSKFALARTIAAILGTLILDQGDATGLLAIAERVHYLPPRSGHQHLRLLLAELARLTPRGTTPVAQALQRASTVLKKRGLVLVLSDLYEEETALGEIRKLRRMGHDVIVIHTLAAEELSLEIGGAVELLDLESGRKLLVQPSAARQAYVGAVRAWLDAVERSVRRDGMDYLRVTTADPLEPALRQFLVERRRAA
jgi:uncharacterized protein (DUF58 family)